MIAMERSSSDGAQSVTQVLLPELRRDAARALFHFLYRDSLPSWAARDASLLHALSRCGKTLRMPRLTLLAQRCLDMLLLSATSSGSDSAQHALVDLPPTTLCRDLGAMVGDPEHSDVRFVAEGKTLAAHRFVLESRVEYFRVMFSSGMQESVVSEDAVVDVVVPGEWSLCVCVCVCLCVCLSLCLSVCLSE